MSLTLAGALLATYASSSRRSQALKITRTDAQVFGFTSAQSDALIDGVHYRSSQGLSITSLVSSVGMAVDNMELSTLDDGSLFTTADILAGVWRNAAFELFEYDRNDPAAGPAPLMGGTIGEVSPPEGGMIRAELRGPQQPLQQPVGMATSITCRSRLGDELCMEPLGPLTHSGTVTAVSDARRAFTASAMAQPSDYFGEGIVSFTSGANAGLSAKVLSFEAGAFVLALPLIMPVAVGDTFSAVAGCRKRRTEDCVGKFDNALNFQGEPDLPGMDRMTAPITRNA